MVLEPFQLSEEVRNLSNRYVSVSETATTSHIQVGAQKIDNIVRGTDSVDFTLGDIGNEGDTYIASNSGTGTVRVLLSGISVFGTNVTSGHDIITIPQFGSAIFKKELDASLVPFWKLNGNFTSSQSVVEIHSQSNAAADPNGTEADDTAGWTNSAGTLSSESTTPSPDTGSFYLSQVNTAVAAQYMSYSFTAEVGEDYLITWRSQKTQGVNNFATDWQGVGVTGPTFVAPGDGVWKAESETVTASATTIELRFYSASQITNTLVGDDYLLDNLSITKVS